MSKIVIASEAKQSSAPRLRRKGYIAPTQATPEAASPRRVGLSWIASSLALLAMTASFAFALSVEQPLPDPAQEAAARVLFSELRCVVCQSESLADSPADVARDMRQEIRNWIAAGKTAAEVKAHLVSRYGDMILMRPPLKASTALLWLGPLLIVAAAWAMAWKYFRSKT